MFILEKDKYARKKLLVGLVILGLLASIILPATGCEAEIVDVVREEEEVTEPEEPEFTSLKPEEPIVEEPILVCPTEEEPEVAEEPKEYSSGMWIPELGSFKKFRLSKAQFVYEDIGNRGYSNLQNPTYQELLDFLVKDKTEEIPYVDYIIEDLPLKADGSTAGTYVAEGFICQDFAMLLQKNANKVGWRCAVVFIRWEPGDRSHALNAFETIDGGLIWVNSIGSSIEGCIGSDSLYQPCYNRSDLYPMIFNDPIIAPPAHPLKYVIYIW